MKPELFYGVVSEESKRKLPLALFKFKENAAEWKNKYLRTGIIVEWSIDREGQTEDNLVAVAMRIVEDRLKAPRLQKEIDKLREALSWAKTYGQMASGGVNHLDWEEALQERMK